MRNKLFRRNQDAKAKAKVRAKLWFYEPEATPSAKWVGVQASQHSTCSCYLCKGKKAVGKRDLTLQERRADFNYE